MKIRIHEQVTITKTRRNSGQNCIHCGEKMPIGTVGLSMTKRVYGGTTMNLWCHVQCFKEFSSKINKYIKENKVGIVSELI